MLRKGMFILSIIVLLSASPHSAVRPEEILDLPLYQNTDGIPAGSDFALAIGVTMKPGWHITSNAPAARFTVPTKVVFEELHRIKVGKMTFPPHIVKEVTSARMKAEIFEGTFYVYIQGHVEEGLKPGEYELKGEFLYQGCDKDTCLPPAGKLLSFRLRIVPKGTEVRQINSAVFSRIGLSPGGDLQRGSGDIVSRSLAEKGLFLTLLLVFLGGLALNLTPCVYPLIPITLSYFGGQEQKGKRLLNASAYVLGIAISYSALGTAAALSGEMFGSLLSRPFMIIIIAVILTGLSLSMFGLYEIRVPRFLTKLVGGEARNGTAGALIMGLSMGVIAAPCIGPFVIGLLTYVAALGSTVKGFLMFFVLSLGLGLPYLFLALFSGRIASLPRSGEWMIGVRRIFGIVLITMVVYFLNPLLGEKVFRILFSATLFLGGFSLIVFERSGESHRGFHVIKSIIATAMIAAALWTGKPWPAGGSILPWQHYSDGLLVAARDAGKPLVIDFYADWCIPCRELDEITFKDQRLQKYADQFVFLKADLTRNISEVSESVKERYGIRGVPTILFLKPSGEELSSLRLNGFEKPDLFIARMERASEGIMKGR
jgi:thiol:disulfide interchange protein DsbD